MDRTSRLDLPFLAPGQTGKEFTHNEALARLDIAVAAAVVSVGANSPPSAPAEGECHIVGTAPGGAWAGQAKALAGYTGGGWRFIAPPAGMRAVDLATGTIVRFVGGQWAAAPAAIADATAGQEVATINAILAALRTQGLIAS